MFKKKKGRGIRSGRALQRKKSDGSSDEEDANGESTSSIIASLKEEERNAKGSRVGGGGTVVSGGADGKKRKREGLVHTFESEATKESLGKFNDATRHSEYETEHDKDARAILEKKAGMADREGEEEEEGVYKGLVTYKSHVSGLNKDSISSNKALGTRGPIRAPTFVRTTCQFDYQPDVCKDYKLTGFCGFGDTCIYLHDRGDYSKGWEQENEWEAKKKRENKIMEEGMRSMKGADGSGDDDDDDDAANVDTNRRNIKSDGIPFACLICKGAFKEPVVTACDHYFCEKCIRNRFKTDPDCPACGKKTNGTFNYPKKLYDKMRKMGIGDLKEFFEKKVT